MAINIVAMRGGWLCGLCEMRAPFFFFLISLHFPCKQKSLQVQGRRLKFVRNLAVWRCTLLLCH